MGLLYEGTELAVIKAAKVVLFIDIITYSIQLGVIMIKVVSYNTIISSFLLPCRVRERTNQREI